MKNSIYLTTMALGVAACGHEATDSTLPGQSSANTITVRAETLPTVIAIEGNIEARNRASLSTRMMARVTAIPVEVGHRVRADQTLIRLGTEDISASRAKVEAAVMAARAGREDGHSARFGRRSTGTPRRYHLIGLPASPARVRRR